MVFESVQRLKVDIVIIELKQSSNTSKHSANGLWYNKLNWNPSAA